MPNDSLPAAAAPLEYAAVSADATAAFRWLRAVVGFGATLYGGGLILTDGVGVLQLLGYFPGRASFTFDLTLASDWVEAGSRWLAMLLSFLGGLAILFRLNVGRWILWAAGPVAVFAFWSVGLTNRMNYTTYYGYNQTLADVVANAVFIVEMSTPSLLLALLCVGSLGRRMIGRDA